MDQARALEALKKYFGYDTFRPLQADIIQHIYAGKDAVVLMPTGGGKSVCFQIPAITLPGTAIVLSPLISLMKDQVEGLKANGVAAAFINSSQSTAEQRQVEDAFSNGELDLLYVSPEKLVAGNFMSILRRHRVNLFAIDEAHCISAWGHDFRPEYTQLRLLKQNFPAVPVLALTATADRLTRLDIVEQLQLNDNYQQFIASFDRPNLSLEVRPGRDRYTQIRRFLRTHPNQSGIVYCLSRRATEQLAGKLQKDGYVAAAYHAGLSATERDRIQTEFINDETPIICATIAFGMGIDKSNVRWVIHYNLPKNLENYYQEIGRAGRDGAPADTLLFYSYHDVTTLREFITSDNDQHNEVQLAKLERMQQYAESLACRRRILLNYFHEDRGENCGNCDICRNPPKQFDGTELAQKALSAIYRLREQAGLNTVVDVLRGSGKREIFERGYDRIKTYGAGRDIRFNDWMFYLRQLINLGYIYVAQEDHNKLKLNPAANRVLFNGEQVSLVQFATVKERQEAAKASSRTRAQAARKRDSLFEHLRQLRRDLAQRQGIPPYLIFTDASLEEMATAKPQNDLEFQSISGVGERKLQRYGDAFMTAIREYEALFGTSANSGQDLELSWELFRSGLSVAEIARKRDLDPVTVTSHLAALYERGEAIDPDQFVTPEVVDRVAQAMRYVENKNQLRPIYEYLDAQVPYEQIRFAISRLRREKRLAE
jgi:ATP-dependent DNA helicase RecQ